MTSLALLLVAAAPWQTLAPGIEYRTFDLDAPTSHPSPLHVVRIDPRRARLDVATSSITGGEKRTAGQWAEARGWVVAINAGMFATDHRSNVGHLEARGHVNQRGWRGDYHALLAFDPRASEHAPAVLVNRPGFDLTRPRYRTLVQNLRLIANGRNRWSERKKRWSEAAVASDEKGRILFLFCRAPYAMYEFNHAILGLPLGVVNAMHVEGGPEASLSIRAPKLRLDLNGSFETGFRESDLEARQWPIPNVLGAR